MTATVNGRRPDVTVGDGVQVCVQAPENPTGTGFRADSAPRSAFTPVHTRAIPQETDIRPRKRLSKVRDVASTHVGDVKKAAAASWFGREQPAALYDLAGDVFPAKGVASNWAHWLALSASGLLRLTVLAVIYLAAFCFTTRTRTAVSTAVLACAYTAHHLTHTLTT